jgi:hypothetical protein
MEIDQNLHRRPQSKALPCWYRTLVTMLSCHENWLEVAHLKTLVWMMWTDSIERHQPGFLGALCAAGRSMWPARSADSVVFWTMIGSTSLGYMLLCFIKRSRDGITPRSTWRFVSQSNLVSVKGLAANFYGLKPHCNLAKSAGLAL